MLASPADPVAVFGAAASASRHAAGEADEPGRGDDAESILAVYRREPARFGEDVDRLVAAAMGSAEQLGGEIVVIGFIRLPDWEGTKPDDEVAR